MGERIPLSLLEKLALTGRYPFVKGSKLPELLASDSRKWVREVANEAPFRTVPKESEAVDLIAEARAKGIGEVPDSIANYVLSAGEWIREQVGGVKSQVRAGKPVRSAS